MRVPKLQSTSITFEQYVSMSAFNDLACRHMLSPRPKVSLCSDHLISDLEAGCRQPAVAFQASLNKTLTCSMSMVTKMRAQNKINIVFLWAAAVQCSASCIQFSDFIAMDRCSVPGIAVQIEGLQSPLSKQIDTFLGDLPDQCLQRFFHHSVDLDFCHPTTPQT